MRKVLDARVHQDRRYWYTHGQITRILKRIFQAYSGIVKPVGVAIVNHLNLEDHLKTGVGRTHYEHVARHTPLWFSQRGHQRAREEDR